MIELACDAYQLQISPERGGSILRLDWQGKPVLRPVCGPSVLDTACFALVPFSNRIAKGRFSLGNHEVKLAPNFPGSDHPHPLHGFGWLARWEVVEAHGTSAKLRHDWPGGEWPWPYRAEQVFELSPEGLSIGLSITNLGESPMFAGLGFHPYFPRDPDTTYHGLHHGEWQNDADCLPLSLNEAPGPRDWWNGQPVATRSVDTVYSGRDGPLTIVWPSRGRKVTMLPSTGLAETVVFSPSHGDFFCVEPVSHRTDQINDPVASLGKNLLDQGQTRTAHLQLIASAL